jgi:hypothetical protein
LRALLEEIGWSGSPSNLEIDPKVDLDTHGWALIEALQDQIGDHADRLRDIDQHAQRDAERDEQRRDLVTRNMNALSALALTVLLRDADSCAATGRGGATLGGAEPSPAPL